jgi:hypothetical protein
LQDFVIHHPVGYAIKRIGQVQTELVPDRSFDGSILWENSLNLAAQSINPITKLEMESQRRGGFTGEPSYV